MAGGTQPNIDFSTRSQGLRESHLGEQVVDDVSADVVVDVVEDAVVVVTRGQPPPHVIPRASSVPRNLSRRDRSDSPAGFGGTRSTTPTVKSPQAIHKTSTKQKKGKPYKKQIHFAPRRNIPSSQTKKCYVNHTRVFGWRTQLASAVSDDCPLVTQGILPTHEH